ncbi:MAG TPA: sulfurtransferase [Xanthomonadaceae bacterium]|nr:sulfurtransferase [Xanthomonadaceae bacterium]
MNANDASMNWSALVSAEDLAGALGRPDLALIDARFGLADPAQGERAYTASHLPGAVYAHLDRDLSDHARHGHGRHPLPDAKDFCARLGAWGITPAHQVVVYDARDGAMAAARAWFMLRLLGHRNAAVLDGGFARWTQLGLPTSTEVPEPAPTVYVADYDPALLADTSELMHPNDAEAPLLIDARAAERFRGDVEPLDGKAGHVPGAVNRPLALNLQADGRFRSADELLAVYRALLHGRTPARAVLMCGSGVTACHNLLAMQHAGLHGARLYADSWSGWISDSSRPIATGMA